ncbi:SMI1/KNR4 family protein [Nocardia brasiliensis]|uniref:SMI1/KNR4 family protein n=1 Tax=Nocardia brasiliensis TaxID=37326 RepID=UPI0024584619|nr:SMI1/KNR4 family protein [Nocardia brasiliensis]
MQNELVVELVRSVRANHRSDRPFTWQACSANGETLSVKAFPAEDHVLPTGSDAFILPSLVGRLDTMLRAPGDHRPLVLEVALDGPAAQFHHSFELTSLTPCSVLLDPEFRYPNHYRGATPRPSAAQPSTLPTDPRVRRHVRSLVDEFTTYYRRVKGRAPQFGPPCPAADLVAAEAALGVRFPDDVRALYELVGDDRYETGLLGRYSLLPLPLIVAGRTTPARNTPDNRVVFEAHPPDTVRRVSHSDWWVTVATDGAGGECAVDLDPAPGGTYGQFIESGHGVTGRTVTAESATALLMRVVDALRRNDIDPRYANSGYLGIRTPEPPAVWWSTSIRVDERDLTELLAARPNVEQVQQLYLNDAAAPDLRALSATPLLRELIVHRAGRVELRLPDTVESVRVHARAVELSAVAAHPALWDVTVTGCPVRVERLAALPALLRLDVSGADVDDVPALADLDLRVLVLDAEQWARLWAADRVPERLAVAECVGDVTLPQLAEWAAWLRGKVDNAVKAVAPQGNT